MPQPEAEEEDESSDERNGNSGTDSDEKDGDVDGDSSSDQDSISRNQADLIYQVILDLKAAGHLAKRELNIGLVASNLVSRYEIERGDYARDLISARSKIILGLMNEAKTPSFDWSRKAIYKELKKVSKRSDLQHIAITPLRRRSEDESSDESEQEEPRPRRRRVRKSVLRPKLSSMSAKQTGKRTRNAEEEEEDSDGNEDADEYETPSKIRGHELVRDPLSTRAKRRTRSILSDSGSTPVQKTPLQETRQSRNTSVSAIEQDVSDFDAQLDDFPPDTWVCRARDCGKVIYKSSTKRGKKLVQDHSLAHASDTQARLDLVFSEQRLNIGLPVDNLINRIQELGSLNPELASIANGTSSVA